MLLRGGRRDAGATEAPGAAVVLETVGEGVEDDIFEEAVFGYVSRYSRFGSSS